MQPVPVLGNSHMFPDVQSFQFFSKGCHLDNEAKPFGLIFSPIACYLSLLKDTNDVAIDMEILLAYVFQLCTVCPTTHVLSLSFSI